MYIYKTFLSAILTFVIFFGCKKQEINQQTTSSGNQNFSWKEVVSFSDIPDFPIKGFIGDKEIKIEYVNFEKWRGSGDNTFYFSSKKPQQNCGAVVNDTAFRLTRANKDFNEQEFIKESFSTAIAGFGADFHIYIGEESKDFNVPWNCALKIISMDDKKVKGKIIMCFKDNKKSWIAGSFEAIICEY
ncbi:MAG: hypothetical protein N2490_08390 [Ignavibacteria bacterium]|nr:hypothetical protein [Ignavibacteria bacterium]